MSFSQFQQEQGLGFSLSASTETGLPASQLPGQMLFRLPGGGGGPLSLHHNPTPDQTSRVGGRKHLQRRANNLLLEAPTASNGLKPSQPPSSGGTWSHVLLLNPCHPQSPRRAVNFTCNLFQQPPPWLYLRTSSSTCSDLCPGRNPPPAAVPPLVAHSVLLDRPVPRGCLHFWTPPSLLRAAAARTCPGEALPAPPLRAPDAHLPPTGLRPTRATQ